jgi:hypothetical protein
MYTLYVGGQRIGSFIDAEKVIAALPVSRQTIEVRDDAGRVVGHIYPPDEEPTPVVVESGGE